MSGINEKLIAARLAGHEWDDIHEHIADQYDAGATPDDLGFGSADDFMQRIRAHTGLTVARSR